MKVSIAGLTIAPIVLATLLIAAVYKGTVVQQPSAARVRVTLVSQNTDRQSTLQNRIGQDAKHRWWMLMVGLTIVAYRLRQKHRALFENSLLFVSHEDSELHAPSQVASLSHPSEFEEIPQHAARAS